MFIWRKLHWLFFFFFLLLLSAGYNNLEVAEYLLEHGADVNAQDKGGLIPLHNAASYGVSLSYINRNIFVGFVAVDTMMTLPSALENSVSVTVLFYLTWSSGFNLWSVPSLPRSMWILQPFWSNTTRVWMPQTNGRSHPSMKQLRRVAHSSVRCCWLMEPTPPWRTRRGRLLWIWLR